MKLGRHALPIREAALHFGEWLAALRPTTTLASGPLRLVRLVGDMSGPDADLLDEALRSGRTSLTEVSATGVVAMVRVTHGGTLPLLLVDGEQIVGAKQNRILNASFLVGPGQSVEVPVSCVERGRWHCRGPSFESSETTIAAVARAAKLRRVHDSLRRGRGYDGDQQAVWREVDRYLKRTGIPSENAAFDDAFRRRRGQAEPVLSSFEPASGQVGLAAVIAGSLVGLDLFGSPALYARGWRKVMRGLLVEVYDDREAPPEEDALVIVRAAIHAIAACEPACIVAPGIGLTLHAATQGVTFSGVVHREVLYHAAAAPSAEALSLPR